MRTVVNYNCTFRLWLLKYVIACSFTGSFTVVPRIIQPSNSSDAILVEGNVLSLECSSSGDPAPVVTWVVPSYTERLVV